MRWTTLIPCVACLGLFGLTLLADEEKVSLDKLPKAVAEAVKKKFPDAKLTGVSKEVVDKKTLYEIQLEDGKQKVDVSVTTEGEIVEIEKEITVKELPKPVRAALEEKYAKAMIQKVEDIQKGKEHFYEVLLVTTEKKTLEIKFDPDGKVVNVEDKTEEKKEEKKDK